MTTSMKELAQRALADHLGLLPDDIEPTSSTHEGLYSFEALGGEYCVGDDEAATQAANAYIADSLWAFNAGFMARALGTPEIEPLIAIAQDKGMCEDLNPALLAIAERTGLERVCKEAILADGRGHFLAYYDGGEHEITIDGQTLYIYRTN